jgi:hypothetical protein
MKPGIEQCTSADFQAHSERYLRRVRQSHLPLFVSDPTEAAVVVMSVASFVALQQGIPQNHDIVRQVTLDELAAGEKAATKGETPSRRKALTKQSQPNSRNHSVYQVKITLKQIRPPIWRRLLVPASLTLQQFHQVIQVAMDRWHGGHLHQFEIDDEYYSEPAPPGEDWGMPMMDTTHVKLLDVLGGENSKLLYTYDFGDNWQHEIVVEKILPLDPQMTYPICLKGKRACPPEDCGGPWGYAELLEILAHPKHPEYRERKAWLIADFDPESFDLHRINAALTRLKMA